VRVVYVNSTIFTIHPLPPLLCYSERDNPQKKYPIWRYNLMLIETLSYIFYPWHFFNSMKSIYNDFVCSLQYSIFSFDRPKYYGHATQCNPIHKSFIIFKEAKFHLYFLCPSIFSPNSIRIWYWLFAFDYS